MIVQIPLKQSLDSIRHKKMEMSVLASGSSGNCFYVSHKGKGILVDAGISCKQIVERLCMLGKSPEQIKGIFVTHEHSDHMKGCDVFARKFNVPIFATKKTAQVKSLCMYEELVHFIKNDESVGLGGMEIQAFSKSHKAVDPVSYTVSNGGKNVSIITDIGYCCENVIEHVERADVLCMESNHDLDLLDNGHYPYFLKQWIKSDEGHVSNIDAASCVFSHGRSRLKHVVLSHLSLNNNTPLHALQVFGGLNRIRPKILVSGRGVPTGVVGV